MPFNEPSFSEKLIQRRESVRRTLRKTSPEELRALVRELAPEGTHPWAESFSKLIDEHQAEPAVVVKLPTVPLSFTIRSPTAASGMHTRRKRSSAWVYWEKPT